MDLVINEDIELTSLIDRTLDFSLESLYNSIKRAIQTPLGYLGAFVIDRGGLNYLDGDLGSPLYEMLSEPFSSDFISQIHQGIQAALASSNFTVNVTNIDIQLFPPDSIQVILEIEGLDKEPVTLRLQL